ncbi:MAG: pyridoxine 5'-phosphate synthase [Endomicrobiia bacterium]
MAKLGVNIDHIATLRQARKIGIPNLLEAARICEESGADGITVHLREDRRHIQDEDVYNLRKKVKTKLNLEMSISPDIVEIALDVKPDEVCIVPERRQELTTEGGLDVISKKERIEKVIDRLKSKGIIVSLFVDPDIKQIKMAKEIGVDCIEIHTGIYANATKENQRKKEFEKIIRAGEFAIKNGLILNAGHGLDYNNVVPIAKIPGMNTLNIGFSIISRAVFVGLSNAVKEMKNLIR